MEISREVKLLISQYKIFPKENLGQNYLVGSSAINYLINSISPKKNNRYIEVGAGFLFITELVADSSKGVLAIEKDKRFSAFYKDFFLSAGPISRKIDVIQEDALKVDFEKLDANELFGNIPYYISSDLLLKIAKSKSINRAVILFQKEFADRILAMPDTSEYGSLTVAVDFYFNKRFLKTFPESFFYPRPTVSSSLIELTRHPQPDVDQEDFLKLIRSSFAMRRKKIVNNLKDLFSYERVVDALRSIGLDRDVRAERLSLNDFVALYKQLY